MRYRHYCYCLIACVLVLIISAETATTFACGAPPLIIDQTDDLVVKFGETLTLNVTADSQETLIYQWYDGTTGDTALPISDATSDTFTSEPINFTRQFWVRVSNKYGAMDSETITAMVINGTELLTNSSFETDSSGDKIPDAWKLKASNGGDKIKCNKVKSDGTIKIKAHKGECAFQIKGSGVAIKTRLQQNIKEGIDLVDGNTIFLGFYAKIKKVNGTPRIAKLIVKHNTTGADGKPIKDKIALRVPENPLGNQYELITDMLTVSDADVEKVKVQLFYRGTSGKIFFDDVTAILVEKTSAEPLLSLPDAPPGFRN